MQIIKNLYQVGGSLNGITWNGQDAGYDDCNTYVWKTQEGLIMFDCGCGDTMEQIFANMELWGMRPEDIAACFLTHAHLDHAGGAHLLKQMGVTLYAHAEAARAIGCGDERCCGYLYHKRFTPCSIDVCLKDGDEVKFGNSVIRAMYLPGHTAGCTAYAMNCEGRKLVVSGDVIGTLLDGYFGWDGSIDFDKKAYLQSLRRFARYDSDIMLPGHGLIYFHEPRRRVEEALNQALCDWR